MSSDRTFFAVVPSRVLDDDRVGDAALAVLVHLCAHSDKQGFCDPKITTLSQRRNVSRQAIQKQISALEGAGYIEREPQFNANGTQSSNRYRILYDHRPTANLKLALPLNPTLAGGANLKLALPANPTLAGGANPTLAPEEQTSRTDSAPKGARDVVAAFAETFHKRTGRWPTKGACAQIGKFAQESLDVKHPIEVLIRAAEHCDGNGGPAAFRRTVSELLTLDKSASSGKVGQRAGQVTSREEWERLKEAQERGERIF